MASFIWERTPQEAYEAPYEYDGQAQFDREAQTLLRKLQKELIENVLQFHDSDRSAKRAVVMLHLDAATLALDALELLKIKKHRQVSLCLRAIFENLGFAHYFNETASGSETDLQKWYNDEYVPHSSYRGFLMQSISKQRSEDDRDSFQNLSKFSHRSFCAQLDSYSLSGDGALLHEAYGETDFLVLPQTIAAYYAALASLIRKLVREILSRETLANEFVRRCIVESLEVEQVPQRFTPKSWLKQKKGVM